jgi:hypothetical protein
VRAQLRELDFVAPFTRGHPKQFELATRVAELTPGDLNRIFFVNSGSEAVDSAMKVALAYQRAIGQGTRTRLIGREKGYHGVGFGGISVGGLPNNRRAFALWPPGGVWFDYQKLDYVRSENMLTNYNTRGVSQHATPISGLKVLGCGGHGAFGRGQDSLSTKQVALKAWTWNPSQFLTWQDDSLYVFMSTGKIDSLARYDPNDTSINPTSVLTVGPFRVPPDSTRSGFRSWSSSRNRAIRSSSISAPAPRRSRSIVISSAALRFSGKRAICGM